MLIWLAIPVAPVSSTPEADLISTEYDLDGLFVDYLICLQQACSNGFTTGILISTLYIVCWETTEVQDVFEDQAADLRRKFSRFANYMWSNSDILVGGWRSVISIFRACMDWLAYTQTLVIIGLEMKEVNQEH